MKIVDEFTGRILEGRRWSEGLHQAVEAREGVAIKEENQTLATITLQNYFRLYDKLAGMTGTAATEAAEFSNTYGLDVVPVPTHLPVVRDDQGDLIYKTEAAKLEAVVDDIVERIGAGQPTLVGTVSVENSEKLAAALDRRGIDRSVLNAKEHTREAEIIAQAGRLGSVTVATNMAGRGVDILLGGNPEGLARRDLLREKLDPDDSENAAELAARVERYVPECRVEGDEVRKLGGLYVLGTERHESRRIDNQLRGRSGRQGDPGASRFYLSLEDDLMRLFATGAVNWVMDRTLPDDVPLEAKMVTKAIERAQNTVEQKNAEVRKNVLKYDEVMNEQRKVIYARREQILGGDDLRSRISSATCVTPPKQQCWITAQAMSFPSGISTGCWPRSAPTGQPSSRLPSCRANLSGTGGSPMRSSWCAPTASTTTPHERPRSDPKRCARWSGKCCCVSSTSAGGSTSQTWIICVRAFTCAGSARRTPWRSGSERASTCSPACSSGSTATSLPT